MSLLLLTFTDTAKQTISRALCKFLIRSDNVHKPIIDGTSDESIYHSLRARSKCLCEVLGYNS